MQPSWHQIAFALPLAFLAYTGLETVANFAEETRRPGRDLPRSLFLGIGAVVLVTVLIALVGLSAYPAPNGTTQLGTTWLRAPLMGIVYALGPHVAYWVERALRVYVGLTGALILLVAAATSNSGFGRLAYSLAEHGQLPRRFGRLSRRSLHSPETVIAAALISMALLLTTEFTTNPVGLPREPLQLRRARRVHGRAARGDQAPLQQAGPRASLPRAALGPGPRRGRPDADASSVRSRRRRSSSRRW